MVFIMLFYYHYNIVKRSLHHRYNFVIILLQCRYRIVQRRYSSTLLKHFLFYLVLIDSEGARSSITTLPWSRTYPRREDGWRGCGCQEEIETEIRKVVLEKSTSKKEEEKNDDMKATKKEEDRSLNNKEEQADLKEEEEDEKKDDGG